MARLRFVSSTARKNRPVEVKKTTPEDVDPWVSPYCKRS